MILLMGGSKYTSQKDNENYLNIAPGGVISSALKPGPHIVYSLTYDY